MSESSRRTAVKIGAVAAAGLVGIAGSVVTPAQAQQAAATIGAIVQSVVNCHSATPCIGGVNTGTNFGVMAEASKNNGVDSGTKNPSATKQGRSGVYGHDDSTDGGTGNVGVAGFSPNGLGMQASSTNGTGLQAGSTNAIGIEAAGGSVGMVGTGDAIGVLGNNDKNGYGLEGYSVNNIAIVGLETIGDQNQVLELDAGTANSNGFAMKAFNSNGATIFSLDNAGNVSIPGNLFTKGFCQNGCSQTHHVDEYAPRESEPTMEDIGEGQLVAGKAFIRLDPAFANVIDQRSAYVVFVSPEGPNQGLYVTQKTARGFEVMENPGGRSTIPFGYRIVAKPYGVTAARLPMSVESQMPARVHLHAGAISPRHMQ